jgi:hypothetical protein
MLEWHNNGRLYHNENWCVSFSEPPLWFGLNFETFYSNIKPYLEQLVIHMIVKAFHP